MKNIELGKALPMKGRRPFVTLTRDFDGAKVKMNARAINFLVPTKELDMEQGHKDVTYVISDEFNEYVRETPQQVLELIYREMPYA